MGGRGGEETKKEGFVEGRGEKEKKVQKTAGLVGGG